MATVERQFVDEYADGTVEVGNLDVQAVTNSDHVKTIAPVFYTPGTVGNDNKITRQTPVTIQGALDAKATKAGLSAGATKCKITYNADGIVTGGADLTASDIKDGTLPVSRGGTGINTTTTVNSVLIGNSSNAASNLQTVATASGAFYATSANGKPTFGTLPIAQGGTGAGTAIGAEYNILNQVADSDATINGDRKFALCNQTKSASNGVFRWVKFSNVWTWIKGLLSSESGVNISGNAATADSATNSTNSAVTADANTKLYLIGAAGSSGQQALKTDTGIYATTESGELNATRFKVNEHCTVSYNSTKSSLDFSFS